MMGRFCLSNHIYNIYFSTGVLKMSIAAPSNPKEITLRGIILGILITLVFTAAQVYLGLKVGLTFATSIPAAVISMALLSAFKDATIQENNIVQTIASAAGTLASVIFVLPGLLMIGWWAHVPFWPTFGACAVGGVLGVMYTVPLRRALVSQSDLPYPEGVGGRSAESRHGLALRRRKASRPARRDLGQPGLGRICRRRRRQIHGRRSGDLLPHRRRRDRHRRFQLAGPDRRRPPDGHYRRYRHAGRPDDRLGHHGAADDQPDARRRWRGSRRPRAGHLVQEVRMMGAGVIGMAAIITLAGLAKPILGGLKSAMETARKAKLEGATLERTEQDMPIFVGLVTLISMVPAGWLLASFLKAPPRRWRAAGGRRRRLHPDRRHLRRRRMRLHGGPDRFLQLAGSGIAILTILGAALSVGMVGRSVMGPTRRRR
jgi:hypothetical protein